MSKSLEVLWNTRYERRTLYFGHALTCALSSTWRRSAVRLCSPYACMLTYGSCFHSGAYIDLDDSLQHSVALHLPSSPQTQHSHAFYSTQVLWRPQTWRDVLGSWVSGCWMHDVPQGDCESEGGICKGRRGGSVRWSGCECDASILSG